MAKNKFLSFLGKTILTLAVIAGILFAIGGLFKTNLDAMGEAGAMMGPPPVSVATSESVAMEWPVKANAVGTVSPLQGVELSVESPGVITDMRIKSGRSVAEGDLLLQLDDSSERAQLAAAQATAELAKLSLDRSKQLLERKTISQAEFDAVDAEFKAATAQVATIESAIDKKRLLAPFDGLLGIRRVNLGQYVNPGEVMVTLIAVDPINVTFFLPQQALSYLERGLKVKVTSDAYPGQIFEGVVAAMEARVNASSRMIEVQAKFPNPDGRLRVGMFVEVQIDQAAPRTVHAVPASSVLYASYGNSIYTVVPAEEGEGLVARQKFVKLGERRGDFVEVLEGLDPSERVVIAGGFKLYPGAQVILQDERAPTAELDPEPTDS